MTTIDGEVVDGGEPDMKLIESDRSDGPDDRTDGADGVGLTGLTLARWA